MLLLLAFIFLPLFASSPSAAATLSLTQAVREAESGSPLIKKAESSLEELRWKRTEALSNFLPTVNANASYLLDKKYALFDTVVGGNAASFPQVIPSASFGLGAKIPLYDAWAGVDRYRAAGDFLQAGHLDLNWARIQVDREIVLLYYRALGAKLLQDVAAQNVMALEDHLREIQLFKKAGVSTNYDVLRVEVQVSEAKYAYLDASDNVALSKQRLAQALGKPFDDRSLTGELPVLKPELLHTIREKSDEERSDLQSLRAKVGALEKLENASSAYFSPKLFLFADYQRYNNRNTKAWPADSAFRDSYGLGVGMSWNLFDGMLSIARSKETVEQRVQSELGLRIAELRAVGDFELWQRKYLYYCSVYAARLNDVEKARESVRLAKAGRKVGARTNSDLLDAESDFNRAQAGLINSQLGSIEALLNLELATGRRIFNFY